MDADEIRQMKAMLDKYLRQFGDCFGRIDPTRLLRTYAAGQLSDLPRKGLERIADAAGLAAIAASCPERPPAATGHSCGLPGWARSSAIMATRFSGGTS